MSKQTLSIANPYNQEQMKAIAIFESENDLENSLTSQLQVISSHYTKEEYEKKIKEANEVEQYLLLIEDSKVIDYCLLDVYKDIKSCYLSLPSSKKVSRSRKMLLEASEYASSLGMLEVFTTISSSDYALLEVIENDGYENLGEENGITSFVRSFGKEGIIDGNNKKY